MTKDLPKALTDLFTPNADILKVPPTDEIPKTSGGSLIKVLFLDIDGVLNSHKTQVIWGKLPFPGYDGDKGFVDDDYASDPAAAALVDRLCEATGAYIVLSSSWRIGYNLEQVRTMLVTLGVNSPVIGKTSQLNGKRGDQIAHWINEFNTPEGKARLIHQGHLDTEEFELPFDDKTVIQTYAIVDDDADMLESQKHHFVQTTFMDGLTCALTLELGKILSDDPTFHLNALTGKPSVGQEWEDTFK
jgi:hypothetical protein